MRATEGSDNETAGRASLAVVVAGVVFPCWLIAPSLWYPAASGWMLFPSAGPTALEFTRWAGAGVMAGLTAASIAPRHRWIIVPPLLILLGFGWAVFEFLIAGAGDIPVPRGTFQGVIAGVALGVLCGALPRPRMRLSGRLALIALAPVALLSIPAISAWRGRPDLQAMRERILPAVEDLLSTDVLEGAGRVQWRELRLKLTPEGARYWQAYGEMTHPKAQIALDWYGSPRLWAEQHPDLEGLTLSGMDVNLAAPQPFDVIEFNQQQPNLDATRRLLRSMGVGPELAARIELRQQSDSANWCAVAIRHGIEYQFDWHTFPVYEYARPGFPSDSVLMTCTGTYFASVP